MPEKPAWSPSKEDLLRLYEVEGLSAAKIASAYGLSPTNSRSGEALILYHLKKHGVERRDRAQHIWKVTPEMADEWARRYEAGESLKQIAADEVDSVTVWNHLKRRGVVMRDKVEAQTKAVSKYERVPLRGDALEKSYLLGLRYGDFDAVRHGRAARVRLSTTHPAMASLFESLFSTYGHVLRYPRTAPFIKYEWTLECDLDCSFEFLLGRPKIEEFGAFDRAQLLSFLAGFFDAEGSIYLHERERGYAPQVSISNTDREILLLLSKTLEEVGVASKLNESGQGSRRLGYAREGRIWRLEVWQFASVKSFLRMVTPRHQEKICKSRLALEFVSPISSQMNFRLVNEWETMLAGIQRDRNEFVREAQQAMSEKDSRRYRIP